MTHPIPPEGNQPLTWLERRVKPLTPAPQGTQPPASVFGFIWHFTRQVIWPLIISSVVGLFEVIADLMIPISLGVLVALLADQTIAPDQRMDALLADAPSLIFLAVMVGIVMPAVF